MLNIADSFYLKLQGQSVHEPSDKAWKVEYMGLGLVLARTFPCWRRSENTLVHDQEQCAILLARACYQCIHSAHRWPATSSSSAVFPHSVPPPNHIPRVIFCMLHIICYVGTWKRGFGVECFCDCIALCAMPQLNRGTLYLYKILNSAKLYMQNI